MNLTNLNFQNNQILKMIHGEINHAKKTIRNSFVSDQDRKIFTLWAQSHLKIVEKSKTLHSIYKEVVKINIDP